MAGNPLLLGGDRRRIGGFRSRGTVYPLLNFQIGVSNLADATFARATTATYVDSISDTLFAFAAGDSLSSATFTRSGTAIYTEVIPDLLFAFAVGDSLGTASYSRTGTATYTEDI